MIVKFFGNKKGGSISAINYLLNEREQQGTAKVLQGNPQLTKDIINSISFKQKVTVGCLSFEEKNIDQEQKYKLMKEFEETLLPGMQGRYNILWVEHTDKGRLELNFVIPKIELETQKSLNPYYHKADLPRVEKWQDLQNLEYKFSNPKDPSKARTLKTNPKEIGLSQDYEQLDKLLHNQNLQSRSHLIELLEANNITITRKGKDYLSIKLPNSKKAKKFKGGIYSEQFTSPGELREISKAIRTATKLFNQRDTQRECERLRTELKRYTETKERELRQKYINISRAINKEDNKELTRDRELTPKRIKTDRESTKETIRTEQQFKSMANSDTFNSSNHISNSSDSIRDDEIRDRNIQISTTQRNGVLLRDNERGAVNDSIGTNERRRVTESQRAKYKSYRETRNARTELYKSIAETAESIRKQSLTDSRELHTTHRNTTRDIQQRIRTIKSEYEQIIQKSESNIRQAGEIEHKSNGLTKLREFGRKITDTIQFTREIITEKFNEIIKYYNDKFKYKSEPLENAVNELQSQNTYLGRETTLKDIRGLEKTLNTEMVMDTIKQEKQQQQRSRSYSHYMHR